MNARIRELKEQAWEYTMAVHDGLIVPPLDKEVWPVDKVFDEKFAELIVQECITQCEQVATAADAKSKSKFVTDDGRMLHEGMWGGAKNCSGQIKQHFGVRE
jgi:hypothetical protein